MLKKIGILLTAVIFTLVALDMGLALDKGNKRKGKYTYRKVYKSCFERGEVESKTPHISPADKTQAEWEAIFENAEFKPFGCQKEWDSLSEEQVGDIYAYLYEHASDSPTPAKCK